MTLEAAPSQDVGGERRASPYRGLMPFTEDDADVFFGREAEVRHIVDTAKARRFGVLYGPSGVGKSSVLQAGVVRQIRDENRLRFERFGAVETVVAYVKEWRDDPYTALVTAVREAFATMLGAAPLPEPSAADDPADEILALRSARGVDLLLILDQFEEFFLYHANQAEDVAELFDQLTERRTRINILVSLREDALALLDRFEADIPGVFDNTLRLEHLDARAAEAAIRSPLDHYNVDRPEPERVSIEDGLVQALLSQLRTGRVQVDSSKEQLEPAADERGTTSRIEAPYLQLVLTRLWDEEARRGSTMLRLATLRELGGAQEIVRQHLDRVMRAFSPPEMAVLAAAFGHLVTPSGSKIAHRPSDLAEFSGHDPAQVAALMHRLAEGDQRILRDVPPPMDEPHAEPRYEIFHDVLALAVLDWRRRFLAESQSRREQAELIAETERVRQETHATRTRLRKARALVGAMALLLVLCIVLAALAYRSASNARDARDDAEAASRKSQRAELKSRYNETRSQLSTDPSAALLSATGFDLDADSDPDGKLQELYRQALDAADTDVELRLGSPIVFAGFAGEDRLVAVTEDGMVRAWEVTAHDPVRLDAEPAFETAVTDDATTRITQAGTVASNGFVVTLADDGEVSAVDVGTGDVDTLDQTFGNGATLTVNDTGTRERVVAWDFERHLAVWDVAKNEVVHAPAPGERLDSASLDATGHTLAMVSGLTVDVWDLDTGKLTATREFQSHLEPEQVAQTAVAAFPSQPGVVLVVVSGIKVEMSRWELDSDTVTPLGANLWWKQVTDAADVELAGFKYLAVAGDKKVMMFGEDGVFQAQTDTASDAVTAIETSPKDTSVWAVATAEGYVELYRTNRYPPQPSWTFRGQTGPLQSLVFSPDGDNLVTGSADGSVRVWRVPDTKLEWYIPDRIVNARFTPDGRYLFGFTPTTVVREDRSATLVSKYPSLFGQAVDMAPSPDGRRAVVVDQYCTMPVEVAMAKKPGVVALVSPSESTCPTMVAWNPDPARNQIVAGTYENRLIAWDPDSGAVTGNVALGAASSEVHSVAISGDGATIVAGSGSGATGELHVVRADGMEEVTKWPTPDVDSVAVSQDGRFVVAAGNDDHRITVWDVQQGTLLHSFDEAVGTLNRVSFSPDEDASRVSAASSAGFVYVWDRESGQLLAVTHRHGDAANQAVFDPEGIDQMFSAGDDGLMVSYACEVCSLDADELEKAAEDRIAQEIHVTP